MLMCFLSDYHYADHYSGGVLCVLAAMSGHAALYRTPGEQEHGKVYPLSQQARYKLEPPGGKDILLLITLFFCLRKVFKPLSYLLKWLAHQQGDSSQIATSWFQHQCNQWLKCTRHLLK